MTSGSLVWVWGGVCVTVVVGHGSRGMEGVPSTLRAGPLKTTVGMGGWKRCSARHIAADAASMGAPQSMRARAALSPVRPMRSRNAMHDVGLLRLRHDFLGSREVGASRCTDGGAWFD